MLKHGITLVKTTAAGYLCIPNETCAILSRIQAMAPTEFDETAGTHHIYPDSTSGKTMFNKVD